VLGFESDIPTISGVGHEVDITIADLVADQRAATPSAAAELVSPDINEWIGTFKYLEERMETLLKNLLENLKLKLQNLRARLQHPGQKLQQQAQHLDHLEQRLKNSMLQILNTGKQQLAQLSRALQAISPLNTLERGYALVTHKEKIITSNKQVKKGEEISVRLAKGSLKASIL